jgi:hypothetical protein
MIDPKAVQELATHFFESVSDHYTRPPSPERVLEVLNALAIVAGTTIAGTGNDQAAVSAWFANAVDQAQEDENVAEKTQGAASH